MDAAALGWSDFAVAVAGAAAALAGLIIVAMSVNIARIMQSSSIPARAAAAIGSLTAAVVTCCLLLVPGQPLVLYGLEVAAPALAQWVLWIVLLRDVRTDAEPGRPVLARAGIPAVPPVLFTVGAVVLLAGSTGGIAWVAGASIVAIVSGVVFAWIALVEILR